MSRRVSYFYDEAVTKYHYGQSHPMKPRRLKLTDELVLAYGLYRHLEVRRPRRAAAREMVAFHSDDFVDMLSQCTPSAVEEWGSVAARFNVGGSDCPAFDGLFEYCRLYTGGSIDAASHLNARNTDIAINWSGGMHHAKKAEASGFCYVNDIVLAILELLKVHRRVLYIDIDIHHGDGVEEAFATTDRVMTFSLHRFGGFFPGSGSIRDIGVDKGSFYSLNCPLYSGMTDDSYRELFRPVVAKIMETFRPEAVVLECGADSITGDRLGCFNLSIEGHADCVRYVKSFGLPTLILGGGGYTPRNVARCWANETASLLDVTLPDAIPPHELSESFGPHFHLHLRPDKSLENRNSQVYLDRCRAALMEALRAIDPAPSVPFAALPGGSAAIDELMEKADGKPGPTASGLAIAEAAAPGSGKGTTDSIHDDVENDPDEKIDETEGRRPHPAEHYESNTDHDTTAPPTNTETTAPPPPTKESIAGTKRPRPEPTDIDIADELAPKPGAAPIWNPSEKANDVDDEDED